LKFAGSEQPVGYNVLDFRKSHRALLSRTISKSADASGGGIPTVKFVSINCSHGIVERFDRKHASQVHAVKAPTISSIKCLDRGVQNLGPSVRLVADEIDKEGAPQVVVNAFIDEEDREYRTGSRRMLPIKRATIFPAY